MDDEIVRQEITVIPADPPGKKKLGWLVVEIQSEDDIPKCIEQYGTDKIVFILPE